METFSMPVQVRWSDLDPNFHLRHSVFYDWGAMCRVEFLEKNGLTASVMEQLQFGPIILREECVFRKEIRLGDAVSIDMSLLSSSRNFTRWSIQHKILKQEGMISAVLTIDGAWLDTVKRKLTAPKEKAVEVFKKMPHTADFQWLD
jgi:acyl-CoA thioester hydrolase